jgi:hypothetical protein
MRFRKERSAQKRRADGVGFLHHEVAPGLILTDGHREGEAEQQAEQAEHGALDPPDLVPTGRIPRPVEPQAEPKAHLRDNDQQEPREGENHPLVLKDGTQEFVYALVIDRHLTPSRSRARG